MSVVQTGSGSGGDTSSLEQTSISLAVATGPATSTQEEGMALQLSGDAFAAGENTLATAAVDVVVTGDAQVQSAYAVGEFTAWGQGTAGAYATASSVGAITGDADHTFSLSYTAVFSSQDQASSEWTATSLTELYALDIDGIPGIAFEDTASAGTAPSVEEPAAAEPQPACGCDAPDNWDITVDGNLALFDISAAAIGDNSLTLVDFSAITVEDQLSSVSVVVAAAIG
ncbi:hypothetical protein [Xanthobacter sediminis]|uniref:hypothetical protein n=1 Tax=Xanthobacter sediminis TaxID=3119926 RepID=UPI0037263168